MKEEIYLKYSDYFWLFMFGGIAGYFFEIIWYFLRKNTWIIKNGTLFGGFQPIYAIGFVLLTILLWKFRHNNPIIIFLLGCVIGGAFEYLSGVFQQQFLNVYTWNYTKFGKLSINGHIYLPYCLLWGVGSLVWIKFACEPLINFVRKMSPSLNKILVITLTMFMLFNLLSTTFVFYRKGARYKGIEPRNKLEKFVDTKYNDDYLDKRFPNLWIYKVKK